jgi:hypothetical protein
MTTKQIHLLIPPAVLYFHNGIASSPYGDEVCPWPHPDGWFVIGIKRFTNGGDRTYQFGPFSTNEEAEARACEIDSMRDSKKPIFEDDKGELFWQCDEPPDNAMEASHEPSKHTH